LFNNPLEILRNSYLPRLNRQPHRTRRDWEIVFHLMTPEEYLKGLRASAWGLIFSALRRLIPKPLDQV
jgi:hypothetical protein